MGVFFYPSFDVAKIDVQGFRVLLALEDVNAYNVTADASLGTLTSDAFGTVAEGGFIANNGDVIEISHDTFLRTFHLTLTATQEDAYTIAANDVATYIVEDLSTPVDSKSAAAYLVDNDNPEIAPLYLGDVFSGTNTLAYTSPIAKNGTVKIFSKADDLQTTGNDFRTAEGFDVFIPGVTAGPLCIFDHFTDAPTTGTTQETLDIKQIDAGRLAINGDKIIVECAGVFAASINEKIIILNFAGTDIFDSTEFGVISDSDFSWSLEFTLIRVSNTTVRVSSELITVSALPFIKYTEITGLDLTANDYDLILYGLTPAAAGDLTLKMDYGLFIPAASTGLDWLLDESGDVLQDEGGDELSEG